MRSIRLILGRDDPAGALGALAAATLDRPGGGRALRKGQTVGPAEVVALAALAVEAPGLAVSLVALDADDAPETEAAAMLGAALAGPGTAMRGAGQPRTRVVAAHTGLLQVDRARLAAANAMPDINVYTLFHDTPVAAGTTLAEAKVTPLAAPRARVAAAAAPLRGEGAAGPALSVRAFAPRRAAALVRERLAPDASERMIGALQKKLAWFGSRLDAADVTRTAADAPGVAAALDHLMADGATLILTAGGSTSDPADPILSALDAIGARLLRRGVPIHPGSLLWVAARGDALIVGVPSCGAFSEQTSLDLLLPRLLAWGAAGVDGIEALAEGGLLTRGMEHRFPPYDARQAAAED
jgi:hypothetical protein